MKNLHIKHIKVSIILGLGLKNLLAKKLRTILTILGISVGIGSIFFLLSIGLGLQRLVTTEIIGNNSVKSIDITSTNSKIVKLNSVSYDKIKNLGSVEKIGRSYSSAGILSINKGEVDTVVYGVDKDYQSLANLNIVKGRLLSDKVPEGALINRAGLEAVGLNESDNPVGKEISLTLPFKQNANDEANTEAMYKIVGIFDSGSGTEVFINKHIYDQAEIPQYSQIKVMATDINDIPNLRKQIESLGLETASPVDTIEQINQIFKYFNVILLGFGAIGMFVAVLGMFNTITISLLERTKEIGLLSAIGAQKRDLRRLFITESILLSIAGSLTGIFSAMTLGLIFNLVLNKLASQRGVETNFQIISTPIWLVLGLMLFMIVVGILVVIIPSRRAEGINPVEALKRE